MESGMKYALEHLIEGRPGLEQSTRVRGWLSKLEDAGFVDWRDNGWVLTDAGRKAMEIK